MSTEDFSPEISEDLITKYDNYSTTEDVVGGAIATVADFAASTWNSLTPKSMETSTEDLLSRIDDNALRVYNENPDTIHTLSFIGGMFVPTGLALKGMKLARTGERGLGMFSEAGQALQKTKVAEAFAKGVDATAEYKHAKNMLYAASAANTLADSVAIEASLVIAMNAHPYMEDYMKDPAKSFLTSVVGFGAFGAGLGHIVDRYAVKGIEIGIGQAAKEITYAGYKDASKLDNLSAQMSTMARNVENWDNILESAKPLPAGVVGPQRILNQYTENMIKGLRLEEETALNKTFDAIISPEMRALPQEQKNVFRDMLIQNPEKFPGIDGATYAKAYEEVNVKFNLPKGLSPSTQLQPGAALIDNVGGMRGVELKELEFPLVGKNAKGEDIPLNMIYSPKFDSFFLPADLKHYGTAVDLIRNPEELTKGMANNFHLTSRYDHTFATAKMSSAAVDADHLKTLKYYDELPLEELSRTAISPDDVSVLNAVYARLTKEIQVNPEALSKIQVVLTKELPNWDKAGEKVIEKVITKTKTITKTLGGSNTSIQGFSSTDMEAMTKALRSPKASTVDLMSINNSLSPEARALSISFSKEEAMWPMHQGMEIAKRGKRIPQKYLNEEQALKWGNSAYKEARKKGMTHEEAMARYGDETSDLGKYVKEILDSKENEGAKNLLKYDDEGYTYLYRGMKVNKAAGHSAGESYTTDYEVALQFASGNKNNVSLYRVHRDEIVGFLGSYNSKAGGEAEILLDVPTRSVAGKSTPITGMQANGHTVTEVLNGTEITQAVKEVTGHQANRVGLNGIFEQLLASKQEQISSYLKQGVPPEVISLHTNTPVETIEAFMASTSKDILESGKPLSNYTSASEIGKYLGTENRAISLSTNMNRVPVTRIKNAIQQRILEYTDRDIKNAYLAGSKSVIAREIGKFLADANTEAKFKALSDGVDKITESSVGNKFLSSTDFALRELGYVGNVITELGKDVNVLVNKRVAELWKPMESSMVSISKDIALTTEFNTGLKVNAGLKGYREFRNGKFFVQDAETPMKNILDAKGNIIGKERNMVPVKYKGTDFEMKSPAVVEAFNHIQDAGREMLEMRNTLNGIAGKPPVNDIGFWTIPFNPKEKNITYIVDHVENKTTVLYGKTAEELSKAEAAWKSSLGPGQLNGRYELIPKGEQADRNFNLGRHDHVFMDYADSTSFHSGVAPEIVSTSAESLVDIANGYDHWIGYGVRSMLDMHMSDVMSKLDSLSYLSKLKYRDQPLGKIGKLLQKPRDPGLLIKNTLLGNPNLSENVIWQNISDTTNLGAEYFLQKLATIVEPILEKGKSFFGKGKLTSDAQYIELNKALEANGVPNPFKMMDEHLAKDVFHVQQVSEIPNMTPRVLALSNSVAASFMLKFLDLSHAYVNAISLPILTSAAMGRKMEAAYAGQTLNPEAKFGLIKTMYNGIRFTGTAEGKSLITKAEELHLFDPIVSEVTKNVSSARNLRPGPLTTIEKGLEGNLAAILSKPVLISETFVRRKAFATGAYMAKEAYPGISEAGIITFARDFMDQAIGNYHAAQRPVMFQGTLGVAMGLFQTYMVTMAQGMYGLIERKNFKALAKMMFAQSSIFGASSLPGFHPISEMIGEHFSDQNVDLTTGLYRALPHGMADMILYGLPSSIGPSVTSRGDIQPRIPNVLANGVSAIPALSILKQAYDGADRVASAAFEVDGSVGRAMLEAISLQSVSRPIARVSELLSGHSITGAGNLIAGPDDVWTVRSVFARAMASRPLEEVKAREALHLNNLYGSIDREKRQKVTQILRTHIRDNNLDSDLVEQLGERYMRTGSAAGWRSAVNHAMAQTETTSQNTVRNYLRPNTPFQSLIDDLE